MEEISIHTYDRIAFKRCRRKWYFSSPLRRNVAPKDGFNENLWFGTGFHFALEDYHGYNIFGDPILAFHAYVDIFEKEIDLSEKALELIDIFPEMMNHYTAEWLP